MSEPKLSPEAKELIRAYVVSLVLPAGALVGLILFVLGFFIRYGAENQAAIDALKTVTPQMLQAMGAIEAQRERASGLSRELVSIKQEADAIAQQLKSTDFARVEGQIDMIAEAIAKRPDFIDKVGKLPARIDALAARLDRIENRVIWLVKQGTVYREEPSIRWENRSVGNYFLVHAVTFDTPFSEKPVILVSQTGKSGEAPLFMKAVDINRRGFKIEFQTWGENRAPQIVHGVRADWLAIGH